MFTKLLEHLLTAFLEASVPVLVRVFLWGEIAWMAVYVFVAFINIDGRWLFDGERQMWVVAAVFNVVLCLRELRRHRLKQEGPDVAPTLKFDPATQLPASAPVRQWGVSRRVKRLLVGYLVTALAAFLSTVVVGIVPGVVSEILVAVLVWGPVLAAVIGVGVWVKRKRETRRRSTEPDGATV